MKERRVVEHKSRRRKNRCRRQGREMNASLGLVMPDPGARLSSAETTVLLVSWKKQSCVGFPVNMVMRGVIE